jgi:hypothetical protein
MDVQLGKILIHEHLKGNLQFETLVLKYDNFFRALDGNTKRYIQNSKQVPTVEWACNKV